MGVVIVKLRVYPEEEADLERISSEIKEKISEFGGKYNGYEVVPIAFGLKALDVKFSYPDSEFNEEKLLEKIRSIKGVNDVEIVNVTLSSL